MNKTHYKYGYIYTDGGEREYGNVSSAGVGVHGYFYNEINAVRIAKVPVLVTPNGYQPKPTGLQLKDTSYNPTYTGFTEMSLRDEDGKVKTSSNEDIKIVDGWFPLEGTNNRAELTAIISMLGGDGEYSCPITCEYLVIRSDSLLTVNALNGGLDKWVKNGWRNSGGNEPKNIDLWKQVYELLDKWDKDKLKFEWIKAHNGDTGNESADRNATMGVMSGINRHTEPKWVINDMTDSEYWESSKIVPTLMRSKWCYMLTNTDRRYMDYEGDVLTEYFIGDHTKDSGDPILLGAEISDATFAVVFNKERIDTIDSIAKFHIDNFYTHKCDMYKSELISMVNLNHVNTPRVLWFLKYGCLPATVFKSSRTDLITPSDHLLSLLCNPPKLSYRSLNIEKEILTNMSSALKKLGKDYNISDESIVPLDKVVVNDITDKLYKMQYNKKGEETGLKLDGIIEQTTKSITLEVDQPCSSKKVKQILTVNIDIPIRNALSGIAGDNPKVYVVCVRQGNRTYRYGTMIITDNAIGYWCGYYQCTRILDDGDLD